MPKKFDSITLASPLVNDPPGISCSFLTITVNRQRILKILEARERIKPIMDALGTGFYRAQWFAEPGTLRRSLGSDKLAQEAHDGHTWVRLSAKQSLRLQNIPEVRSDFWMIGVSATDILFSVNEKHVDQTMESEPLEFPVLKDLLQYLN